MSYTVIPRAEHLPNVRSNPVSWIDEGGKRIRRALIPPFQLRLAQPGLLPSALHHWCGPRGGPRSHGAQEGFSAGHYLTGIPSERSGRHGHIPPGS